MWRGLGCAGDCGQKVSVLVKVEGVADACNVEDSGGDGTNGEPSRAKVCLEDCKIELVVLLASDIKYSKNLLSLQMR